MVTRLDGAGFAARLAALLAAYAPETNAVQLNVLGSHDTPRILSLLGGDREALELAVLLQATLPGAPCIYYGDEVGVMGGIDPDSRRAFPWDAAQWDGELYASVRATVALRHAEPALRADEVVLASAAGAALAYQRVGQDRRLAVAVNAGEELARLALARDGEVSGASVLLAVGRARAEPPQLTSLDGIPVVDLPPRSGAVVLLR
jgi:glycosidase